MTKLLGGLERLASLKAPAWSSYRPEAHPIVLIGPDRPAPPSCALIWRGTELDRVALAEPVPILTGVFGYWIAAAPGPKALPEFKSFGDTMRSAPVGLVDVFRRHGIDRAMLLRVDFDPAPLAGFDLSKHFRSYDVLRFMWIVHETFHLNAQFPTWLDQAPRYGWPAWDRQPSRPELVTRCYGGKDAPLAADERAALVGAFDALERRSDTAGGCAAIHRFLDARRRRYAALADIRVGAPGGPVGCETAEAIMELEEGGADYVATATELELGLMSLDEAATAFLQPIIEPFYGHGSMQLLVMRRLLGADAMRTVTDRIAASADANGGITGELTRAVAGAACTGT